MKENGGRQEDTATSTLDSLEQLQRHGAFGLSLHTFTPELEFGVDGAMKLKLLLQRLGVEGTDRWVVAHLL